LRVSSSDLRLRVPKVDLKHELKNLYRPSAEALTVAEVPPMNFLTVNGRGDPNTARGYQDLLEALYAVAYEVNFQSEKEVGRAHAVPPLENPWWAGDMASLSTWRVHSALDWTMLIMQPDWIDAGMVTEMVNVVIGPKELPYCRRSKWRDMARGSRSRSCISVPTMRGEQH
jgi:hypothetical protein